MPTLIVLALLLLAACERPAPEIGRLPQHHPATGHALV